MNDSLFEVIRKTIRYIEVFSSNLSKDKSFLYRTLLRNLKLYYENQLGKPLWLYKLFPNYDYVNYQTCTRLLDSDAFDESTVEQFISLIFGPGFIDLISISKNNSEMVKYMKILMNKMKEYGEFRKVIDITNNRLVLQGEYGVSISSLCT